MEQKIKRIVGRIKKNKEVMAVILFGSYVRSREYARDVDICVVLDKKYANYEMSKKRLEYLNFAPDKFDIQIFQLLPLNIRVKVLKEGKILYSKNLKKLYDISYQTIKDYFLFEPRYKDYIKAT